MASAGSAHDSVILQPPLKRKRLTGGLQTEGPVIHVVVVGIRHGRWMAEHEHASIGLTDKYRDVHQLMQHYGPADVAHNAMLVGMMQMKSWSAMRDEPTQQNMYMMRLLEMKHRRSNQIQFLEHVILRRAYLVEDIPADFLGDRHTSIGARAAVQRMVDSLFVDVHLDAMDTQGGQQIRGAVNLVKMWTSDAQSPDIYCWPVWLPLARCMVRGHWRSDVTAVVPRDNLSSWKPPVMPSRRYLQSIRLGPGHGRTDQSWKDAGAPVACRKGVVGHQFTATHLMDALATAVNLRDQRRLKANTAAQLKYMHPRDWKQRLEELRKTGHKDPEKDTMARTRVKFDCAAMLANRDYYARFGPAYRYLACDASPQKRMGYEVFVSRERVILRSSLAGKTIADVSEIGVQTRTLPVAGLGQGACGVANKVHAHVHQTWLDYGPHEGRLRSACNDVRQLLTDMGPEFDVADYGDIIPGYLGQAISSDTGQSYLYPLAMQVPGIRHIIDWVIQDVLYELDFWPAFNKDTTRIIAYFNKARHRELVKKKLLAQAPADIDDMLQSLRKGTQVWAHWRWQTLARTLADMQRIEAVAKCVFEFIKNPSKELSMRNASEADLLRKSVLDGNVWDQVNALQYILKWPMHFSTWITGCDCHNDELAGHPNRTIVCPWKGCRAPSVAKKYLDILERIAEDRSCIEEAMFGSVPSGVVQSAMTRLMSRMEMKLHWLFELPYTIWRADDPEVAAKMLAEYDTIMEEPARARHVHRVAHHFLHRTSAFRADMEQHSHGHGMTPALGQEILSYQLCMLDDTFQEAPHRDISGIVKKAPGSKPAWWFSSMRLAQNIKFREVVDHEQPNQFANYFVNWKAVIRFRPSTTSDKLVPVRRKPAAVINRVYRIGHVNLEDLTYMRPTRELTKDERKLTSTALRNIALQKDFLNAVAVPGKVFTLPGLTSFQALGHERTSRASGHEGLPERPLCFEIVDLDTFSKKHVRTARVRRMMEFQFPAMVQMHAIHRFRDYPGHEQTIFPDGKPREVDILNMGVTFQALMTDICDWSVQRESDIKGCMTLSNPELMSQRQWLSHNTCIA